MFWRKWLKTEKDSTKPCCLEPRVKSSTVSIEKSGSCSSRLVGTPILTGTSSDASSVSTAQAAPIATSVPAITEAMIACKAYSLWEAEGYPEGRSVTHWLMAKEILEKRVNGL